MNFALYPKLLSQVLKFSQMFFVLDDFRIISACYDEFNLICFLWVIFKQEAESLNGQIYIFLSLVSIEGEKILSINFRFHFLDSFSLCDFLVKLRKIKGRVEHLNLNS